MNVRFYVTNGIDPRVGGVFSCLRFRLRKEFAEFHRAENRAG